MATVATYPAVVAAANHLVRQGKNPTVNAVLAELQGGSSTTVLKHLKAWRAVKAADAERDPLPDALQDAFEQAWAQAQDHADARHEERQREWQSMAEAWDAERATLHAQVAERDDALAKAKQTLLDQTHAVTTLTQDRDRLQMQVNDQSTRLTRLQAERVETERAHQDALSAIENQAARALEALTQSTADTEVHLLRQLDDERQRVKALDKTIQRLEKTLDSERQKHADALMSVNDRHQSALTSLQTQLSTERADKARAESEAQVRAEQAEQATQRADKAAQDLQATVVAHARLDERYRQLQSDHQPLVASRADGDATGKPTG